MKGNIFRLGSMAMTMALATMGLFASCSSDDTLSQGGQGGVLTVSVTPSNAVNTNTRAAATGEITNATENTVNRIAVGLVNSEDKVVKIVDQATNSNGVELTASDLQDGEKVLVAVNAPENTFNGVTTPAEFKAKTLSIAEALWGGTHDEAANANPKADNNHIPMYGEGAISSAGTQNFTANVNVYHLVSKVSLQSIKVDLKGAYSNATFQPTEIFMANVPNKLGFSMASGNNTYTYTTADSFESGEQTTDGPGSTTVTATSYPYLSTGALSGDNFAANNAGEAKTYSTSLPVFYTMPNNQTAGQADGATFLVIKGKFTNGSSPDVCYYPVYINYNTNSNTVPDGGTEKQVHPNYNYKVSVVINGKGSDSPTKPVDNSAATVTVNAKPFVDANQTTNVNGTQIGDYVFSDGTWGPLENISSTRYPIAVIFSNNPSATDIAAGYKHGYAMALAAAGPSCAWGANDASALSSVVTSTLADKVTAAGSDATAIQKVISDIKADYDGRTETNAVLALDDAKGTTKVSEVETSNLLYHYPAFYYAHNFGTANVGYNDNNGWGTDQQSGMTEGGSTACAAPKGTSGWYLGSIGQYYLVAKNLGGNMSDETDASWQINGSTYWCIEGKSFDNAAGVSKYITAAADAMKAANVTAYTPNEIKCETGSWHTTWYWTSSEYSAGHGFLVRWGEADNFFLYGNTDKSAAYAVHRGVRPVLAF